MCTCRKQDSDWPCSVILASKYRAARGRKLSYVSIKPQVLRFRSIRAVAVGSAVGAATVAEVGAASSDAVTRWGTEMVVAIDSALGAPLVVTGSTT